MLGFRRKPCLACPQPHSQPGRSPTHLLELRVDELQPVGVNLVQVIAAAPLPIRLGALATFGAARGHLGEGAFQRWEDPRKSRGDVMRGGTLGLLPSLGLRVSSELAEVLVGKGGIKTTMQGPPPPFPSSTCSSHLPALQSQMPMST